MIMQELVRRSNDETRRLRELESRLQGIEERASALENMSIDKTKKLNEKLADIELSVSSLTDEVRVIQNTIDKLSKQMAKMARKRDLLEVEKMVDLLSPIRQEK